MEKIDAALERNKDKIAQILVDFGIPSVPVVDEKRKSKNADKPRGAVVPKTE